MSESIDHEELSNLTEEVDENRERAEDWKRRLDKVENSVNGKSTKSSKKRIIDNEFGYESESLEQALHSLTKEAYSLFNIEEVSDRDITKINFQNLGLVTKRTEVAAIDGLRSYIEVYRDTAEWLSEVNRLFEQRSDFYQDALEFKNRDCVPERALEEIGEDYSRLKNADYDSIKLSGNPLSYDEAVRFIVGENNKTADYNLEQFAREFHSSLDQ